MTLAAGKKKVADLLPPLLVGLLILGGWEVCCRVFAVPSYLVPQPSLIAKTLVLDAPALLHSLMVTLRVTFTALALSIVIGTAIAFLFVQSPIVERSFFPYAVILQVTPIVAIAPLIIILVKNTQGALVICATIIAIFPIISNTTIGLHSVDGGHQDLFAINRASRLQNLIYLRIPSALPFFFAGLRVSSGLALIGAVVAEFVAGDTKLVMTIDLSTTNHEQIAALQNAGIDVIVTDHHLPHETLPDAFAIVNPKVIGRAGESERSGPLSQTSPASSQEKFPQTPPYGLMLPGRIGWSAAAYCAA